jgi:hypothetical protein
MRNSLPATPTENLTFSPSGVTSPTSASAASICWLIRVAISGTCLIERHEKLRHVLIETDDDTLRFSEEFPDPLKLLEVVDKMGLEGIVSKRRSAPYISGPKSGWIKVKAPSWRAANKDRGELFHRFYFLPAGSSLP